MGPQDDDHPISWAALGATLSAPPALSPRKARYRLVLALHGSLRELRAAMAWLQDLSPPLYAERSEAVSAIEQEVKTIVQTKGGPTESEMRSAYAEGAKQINHCANRAATALAEGDDFAIMRMTAFADSCIEEMIAKLGDTDEHRKSRDVMQRIRYQIARKRNDLKEAVYSTQTHTYEVLCFFFAAEARAIQLKAIHPPAATFLERLEKSLSLASQEQLDTHNTPQVEPRIKALLQRIKRALSPKPPKKTANELGSGYARMSRRAVRRYQI